MTKKTQSNKITFIANRAWHNEDSISKPIPSVKTLPEWYKGADRYAKQPDGKFYQDPIMGGKIPTWKACPAIYDVMGSGYLYRTPSDIEFAVVNNKITATVLDSRYDFFLHQRDEMPDFEHPYGYHKNHFAWWPDWSVRVPEGYSILYTQPLMRYELPFLTTSGIIDNDKVHLPGTMPFFIRKDWEGILPAGTPFAQLLPFKREDWSSDIEVPSPLEMHKMRTVNTSKFRVKDGGVYLKDVWERRKYE